MRLSPCLIAVAAFATAAPAIAQQQPPLPPPQQPQPPVFRDLRPMIASNAWTRSEYETFLQAARGNNLPSQPLARVDLANRVSTLMELGRCTEARNEARTAGDRLMAVRARQLCRTDRDG
ncbi:hypothetical protein [Brevundimonas sp.]|uniref:hypothetical protein n=1 Tax=Brevundimonas sp. TaxID=1871086 RepID=UPI002D722B7D|nr:hypothetical protein [Brevundimonas sp.]HYC74657.1 hypothetical protein [Brevundimonas sp.]